MPALARPALPSCIELPPRQARLAGESDVLVVGGGPAGLGAALGAAAAGADVILVERYAFLGGNATAALVMPLMSFYTEHHVRERGGTGSLLPADHGPGEPVLAGVVERFLQRLIAAGGAIAPSLRTGYTVPFDPELFKLVAMELLDEAGVRFLFHAFASGVLAGNDGPDGVVFESKSGPVVIRARQIVDCTGDGDVAAAAGAPFELGRDDGLVQPMTLMFRMVDFEHAAFNAYARAHPTQWRSVHGLWDLIRLARESGELDLPRDDLLMFATPHRREVAINSTRVNRALGIDVWSLTAAEWTARRQMDQIVRFLRRHVPGFEKAYAVQSGVCIGVRETRRIVGDYQLTADDVLGARKFADAVARCSYPLDIHDPVGAGTVIKRLPAGESYDIPLRCLLPRRPENVLVAGRCISGTHEAMSSYRVMPVSMATGQAAGVCAALAAQLRITARRVPYPSVQAELRRQGASLPTSAGEEQG